MFNDGYFTLRIRENAAVEGNPTKIKTFFLFYLKKKYFVFSSSSFNASFSFEI